MHVVVAVGHGRIWLRSAALPAGRGDIVPGVARNPDHRVELDTAGAFTVVMDLETAGVDADVLEPVTAVVS